VLTESITVVIHCARVYAAFVIIITIHRAQLAGTIRGITIARVAGGSVTNYCVKRTGSSGGVTTISGASLSIITSDRMKNLTDSV